MARDADGKLIPTMAYCGGCGHLYSIAKKAMILIDGRHYCPACAEAK